MSRKKREIVNEVVKNEIETVHKDELIGDEKLSILLNGVSRARYVEFKKAINNSDETMEHYRDEYKENLLTYSNIIKEGIDGRSVKIKDYLGAVKFVTCNLAGHTKASAYIIAFPDRYIDLIDKNGEKEAKETIYKYASAYSRTKIVKTILETSHIPLWILNQDMPQKAIKVLADIMENECSSDKARVDAALGLLKELKKPEALEINKMDNTSEKPEDVVKSMLDRLAEIATSQKKMIEGDFTTVEEVINPN